MATTASADSLLEVLRDTTGMQCPGLAACVYVSAEDVVYDTLERADDADPVTITAVQALPGRYWRIGSYNLCPAWRQEPVFDPAAANEHQLFLCYHADSKHAAGWYVTADTGKEFIGMKQGQAFPYKMPLAWCSPFKQHEAECSPLDVLNPFPRRIHVPFNRKKFTPSWRIDSQTESMDGMVIADGVKVADPFASSNTATKGDGKGDGTGIKMQHRRGWMDKCRKLIDAHEKKKWGTREVVHG